MASLSDGINFTHNKITFCDVLRGCKRFFFSFNRVKWATWRLWLAWGQFNKLAFAPWSVVHGPQMTPVMRSVLCAKPASALVIVAWQQREMTTTLILGTNEKH